MLKSNDLYVKNCRDCGLTFRTDRPKVKLCSSCRTGHRKKTIMSERAKRKKPKKDIYGITGLPFLTIDEMCKVIRSYNQQHNTNYTYGRFVLALREGRIEL